MVSRYTTSRLTAFQQIHPACWAVREPYLKLTGCNRLNPSATSSSDAGRPTSARQQRSPEMAAALTRSPPSVWPTPTMWPGAAKDAAAGNGRVRSDQMVKSCSAGLAGALSVRFRTSSHRSPPWAGPAGRFQLQKLGLGNFAASKQCIEIVGKTSGKIGRELVFITSHNALICMGKRP